MSAVISKNSLLGEEAEKRKKQREQQKTAVSTGGTGVIDRSSAMGQLLLSTADDTVNSIAASMRENAEKYNRFQSGFSSFAENNSRYVSDTESAQNYSQFLKEQGETVKEQKRQLSRLGIGEGNELYDTLSAQSDYFDSNRTWLNDRMKYSSQFKNSAEENRSYNGWLDDNADTNSETAAARAKIYDENSARIAELEEEMKAVGRQWSGTGGIPAYTGWGDKAKYKELKAEKERLEAENTLYDRTQGKTDSNYKLTQNEDFAQYSSAGENKNPSYEAMQQWYADSETARETMNGERYRQLEESKPVVDDKLRLYDSAREMNETEDFFNTHGTESDTWGAYYTEGQNSRWDLLTDDERGIYYYLRNTKGKEAGDEFLEGMATVLGKRATDEIARNAQNMSGGELFVNNLVTIPAQILGNIGAFTDTVTQLVTGKEYNPYSLGNRIQAYSGTVRGETANRLDEATNDFSVLGQSAGDVYQALMSSADSAVGAFVLGSPLHLAQAGMGALTSTARELYEKGASSTDILGVSVAAGVFETLFEKVSLDHFTETLMSTPTRIIREVIKKTLVQGGVEASEEFFTELANMATEAAVLGDNARIKEDISKYMQQGDTESAATAKAWMMNLYNAAADGVGQLAETAYTLSNNAQTHDENNRIDGQKVSRADRLLADAADSALNNQNARTVGRLADSVQARNEQIAEQLKKTQTDELVKDAGIKGIEKAAVKRALNSENGGRISQRIIDASDVFSKAEQTRTERAQQKAEERRAKIEQTDNQIKADEKKITASLRNGKAAELVKNRVDGVRSDGLDVSLGAVTGVENGRITVEFDPDTHASAIFDGSSTESSDTGGTSVNTVRASSTEINALYDGISKAVTGTFDADSGTDVTGRTVKTGTKMSVNAANLALGLYNETANTDTQSYTRIMYETYKAGKRGLPYETLRANLANEYDIAAYDGSVTETQLKQMYKAGVSEFEARPGVQRIGVKNVTQGKHKHALTQLSAIDEFARRHNISIVAVDSLTDAEGNAVNGEYRTGGNIVISLDADGGLYMPVVGHELFHYAEEINAADAKMLAEMITNTLKQTKGAEWLEARRREYADYGYKGSEIDSEIAADFFGAAVTQKEFERQVKKAELNKSFSRKIIDKVKEVVAELKEIMQKLRGQRLIYDATLDTDAQTLDFFVGNLERILSQAGTDTKNTAENSGVKRQNKISVEMNDAERAEVLRHSAIDIVKYKGNVADLNAPNVLALQKTYRANAAPVLKKLAEKFGVFDKTYFNKNISLDFSYSRGSLKESVNKQGKVSTDFYDFAKMLYVFDDVVNNAVPIEAHTDKYAGTERANQNLKYDYVLLSAFSDGDYIIPVEMHIKEFSNKDPNKLYVSITLGKIKTEDGILAHPSKRKNVSANVTPPSSKINVTQLISKVNPGFSDFYKYIPSELLTEAQISSKTVALDDEKYRLGVLRGEDVSGMLREKAENAGYSPDDSWKMNHRAPNADDDTAHNMAEIDAAYGGDGSIYSAQAAYYYGEGRSYARNAIRVIQSARNNPDKQITVYRAVPADLRETRLRNGDWVAIVKDYAVEHGERVLDGNYKIIKMTAPAKYLYSNGDSINEWGFDNGNRREIYKNTENNIKILDITYDNNNELIPLSKRYDENNPDIRFQRKIPDVQEKLRKMSGSDDIDAVKSMAYGIADDFMQYAKSARLEMTETDGLMPQATRIAEIVSKYNDYKRTGISNGQLQSDITDIFTDYMNGVGSSDTLYNCITDVIMKRELNSYEVIGDETFKTVRAYADGGRFSVGEETVRSLTDTFGSLGRINETLRESYGFTVAVSSDARAANRLPWAPVGALLAEEVGYVFDGTDYAENAKAGFEYETLASLLQTAENDPRIYRGFLTGADTPDARILAQDELADYVEEEALKMYGELMSAPARSTKADRYKKKLLDYSVKHTEQIERLQNRLNENKKRVEELKAENKAKMKDLRDTKNARTEAVRQAYRERIEKQRIKRNETASKAKIRAQITKKVKSLNSLLTRETDAKHIPQELKHTVAEFLLPFSEDSSVFGTAKDSVFSLEKYLRLNDLLTGIYNATEGDSADSAALNEQYRSLAGSLDGDLLRDFAEMRGTMANKRLSELSLDELQIVNNIVANIAKMVKQGNETFINGKKELLNAVGDETVSDLTSRRQRRKRGKAADWVIDLMNDYETTPIYFFGEKLGGAFGKIYRDIRDAQDAWYTKCAEAQAAIEELQKKHGYKEWSGKNAKAHTFTLENGNTVRLTDGDILSVYATLKREQNSGNATAHVFDGGIVIEDELLDRVKKKNDGGKTKETFDKYIRSEAQHLTENDIGEILSVLTDGQKAYADGIVSLLSNEVGAWGNETSMEMYGYKKFTEEYYFPVTSDKSYLYTRFGISDDTRLKHAGFTNKVVKGANNPIVISDFTDVAARHINQMALYSSFTVPIENMTRLYNYETAASVDADGHTVRGMSVKKALTNAYGTSANDYISDFVRALNGGIKADSVEGFIDKGTSAFKRAAVMANLSVIVQQPSAIARAAAVINPRFLVGIPSESLPSTISEMYKYSAVAGIKRLGGFDTGTGTGVTQWLSNAEQTFSEKASDLLGKGAEKADEYTWANIWAACKRETDYNIRSGKSDIEAGSGEYFRAVSDRFRDIVDYTQVYDSVLTKSRLMRSKSAFAKMVTSFMAEPTLSYNLVVNSFKGNTINGGRAIAAFAANVVLNTLLQSLVAALRDDEDESYWERYLKNVTESLTGGDMPAVGSEFNVFGNLPIVKDAISVMQGYDVERSDISLLADSADIVKKLTKVTANREKYSKEQSEKYKGLTLYHEKLIDVLWDAGVMITNFTPLPMQSVSREIKGIVNNISHWYGEAEHFKTVSYTAWDAVKAGAGAEEDKPLKAYNAVKNNEAEVLRRMRQSDSFTTWVRNGLEMYDERIKKAADANYSGDYGTYESLVAEVEKDGFDKNDIISAVESLVGDMRPEEENVGTPADKHMYTVKMLEDAIKQGNAKAAADIGQKLRDVEGKTDENITSAIKDIAKEYFESGDEAGARRILKKYGGFDDDGVNKTVAWFEYSAAKSDGGMQYSVWQTWRDKASSGQINGGSGAITATQYEEYYNAVKDLKGDDLDGDGKTDSGSKKKRCSTL